MILGDFNARSYSWWSEDILSVEGNHIDSLTSMFGLHQVISGPTHILSQSSSCIDLIFTDQPHLVTDCGIHASLHPDCHHQITYYKLNIKITYPPPYKCLVWDYKKGNSVCIKKALRTVFLTAYLAVPQPTLGHFQGESLTNPMLINAFFH